MSTISARRTKTLTQAATQSAAPIPNQSLPFAASVGHLDQTVSRTAGYWSRLVLVLVYGLSLLLISLGGSRVLTYHETLFAEPAREMVQSGDWLLPRYLGVPSTHKPPLTYWLQALAIAGLGTADWVPRLPTVLAAGLLIWLVFDWTWRWLGPNAALFAGFVQSSSFYVLMQARLAESDMLLALCITLGYYCYLRWQPAYFFSTSSSLSEHVRWWWGWGFYTSASLAFLTKGPIGPLFIGGGIASFELLALWWSVPSSRLPFSLITIRQLISKGFCRLRELWHPVGLLTCLLCCFAWPLATYASYPAILADWQMHHLGRFQGAMGGQKDPFFYSYMLLALLLPWTPFTLLGVLGLSRQHFGKNQSQTDLDLVKNTRILGKHHCLLLASWFSVGFLLLSWAAWKHKHYLIPLLPGLSVAAGWELARWSQRLVGLTPHWYRLAIGIGCLTGLSLPVCYATLPAAWLVSVSGTLFLGGGGLAGSAYLMGQYLLKRRQHFHEYDSMTYQPDAMNHNLPSPWQPIWQSPWWPLFIAVWLVGVWIQVQVMPLVDSYRDQTEFANHVNQLIPKNETLVFLALPENQIGYYLRPPLQRLDQVDTFIAQVRCWQHRHYTTMEAANGAKPDYPLDDDGCFYVIGPELAQESLFALGEVECLGRCPSIRKIMQPQDRITLWKIQVAELGTAVRE